MNHSHHHHKINQPQDSNLRLAFSATLHCLLGCGLGEVAGMIISTVFHLSPIPSIMLAVILGIIGGFALGIVPWLKQGLSFMRAAKMVLIVEGLSIAVMEAAEVLVEVFTPGVMQAHLNDGIFWLGMLLSLIAGFAAAFPVNYWFVKRGVRHQH